MNERDVINEIINRLRLEIDEIDERIVYEVRVRAEKIAQIDRLKARSPMRVMFRSVAKFTHNAVLVLLVRNKTPVKLEETAPETKEASP